jgi:hypothetical protein
VSLGLLGAALLIAQRPTEARAADDDEDAQGASAGETEVVITEKARAHFKAGVNLLQDPDGARYEEAYAQFKAAYAESPSWKILNNFGITAMKLEKDGEAIDAFRGYLDGGGDQISEDERAQTTRDLETLEASVVTVTIKASPEGVKLVDERITNQGGNVVNHYATEGGEVTLRVRPGNHKITAKLPGYDDAVFEFNAPAASTHEHTFLLEKPKDSGGKVGSGPEDTGAATHRPVPVSVWISASVTGALVGGAVGTGIVALGKNSKYDDANTAGEQNREDLRDQVKTFNLVTDVLIGGAVVGGIVTTVLYVTRPSVPKESALRFEPLVGPQIAALSLRGKF